MPAGSQPSTLGGEHAGGRRRRRLAALLEASGQCDPRTVERGRRVAEENGQRLDRVLLQLGLVNERDLADAYAGLLGLPLADPGPLSRSEPLFADRLAPRFLRAPAPCRSRRRGTLVVAMADPLDRFIARRHRRRDRAAGPRDGGCADRAGSRVRPAVSGRPPPTRLTRTAAAGRRRRIPSG